MLPEDILRYCIVPYLEFEIFYHIRYWFIDEFKKRIHDWDENQVLVAIEQNDLWLMEQVLENNKNRFYHNIDFFLGIVPLIPESFHGILGEFFISCGSHYQYQVAYRRSHNLPMLSPWDDFNDEHILTYPEPDSYLLHLYKRRFLTIGDYRIYADTIRRYISNIDVYAEKALSLEDEYLNLVHLFWNGNIPRARIRHVLFNRVQNVSSNDRALDNHQSDDHKQLMLISKLYISRIPYNFTDLISEEELQMVMEDIIFSKNVSLEDIVNVASDYLDKFNVDKWEVLERLHTIHGKQQLHDADSYELLDE